MCVCVQGLVARASLQNQLLRRLCRTLISSSSGNSPTFRQVRLQDWNPRNQVDPLWRYFTRHDNTRPGTPLPATDKTFWNNATLFAAQTVLRWTYFCKTNCAMGISWWTRRRSVPAVDLGFSSGYFQDVRMLKKPEMNVTDRGLPKSWRRACETNYTSRTVLPNLSNIWENRENHENRENQLSGP